VLIIRLKAFFATGFSWLVPLAIDPLFGRYGSSRQAVHLGADARPEMGFWPGFGVELRIWRMSGAQPVAIIHAMWTDGTSRHVCDATASAADLAARVAAKDSKLLGAHARPRAWQAHHRVPSS
jgi:hypothetical protein